MASIALLSRLAEGTGTPQILGLWLHDSRLNQCRSEIQKLKKWKNKKMTQDEMLNQLEKNILLGLQCLEEIKKEIEEAQSGWEQFMKEMEKEESWTWAVNKMSKEVCEKWNAAMRKFLLLGIEK